jgi:hypothetical protein
VISNVAFGLETKCLGNPSNEFRQVASDVFNPPSWETFKFVFMMSFQEFSKFIGLTMNSRKTIDFFMDVVTKSVKYREEKNVKRNDFLQLLIESMKGDEGLTMDEVAANSCELLQSSDSIEFTNLLSQLSCLLPCWL